MAKKPTPAKTTRLLPSTTDPRTKGVHPRLRAPKNSGIPPPEPPTGPGKPTRYAPGSRRRQVTTFLDILEKGVRSGKYPNQARKWYRDQAAKTRVTPTRIMNEDTTQFVGYPQIGQMYLFQYDPKHKKTLPYYDSFPLIFPIEKAKGGFLGINMHYLPPLLRAKLMDSLYTLSMPGVNENEDKNRLRISYNILKEYSQFAEFKPCIKHYLATHVRSRFLKIIPYQWDMCLWLPLARFKKATQEQVWRDSRRIIRESR